MDSILVAGLKRHGLERGAALAVREVASGRDERTFTWKQLLAASAALARRLEGDAVGGRGGGGGPVVVCGGNDFEVVAGILAGLWAGVAVAPIAPESTPSELRNLCAEVDARVVLAAAEVAEVLEGRVDEFIELASVGDLAEEPFREPSGRGEGSILLRSSGTTGPPKVVRRSAAALDAVGEFCRGRIGMGADDVVLLAIPAYHSYGIDMGILSAIPAGSTLELHGRFEVGNVRASLAERGTTVFPAVPVMLDSLARGAAGPLPAPALQRVISAGSPLSAEVAHRFTEIYGVPVGQIYGATEFGSVAYNDPSSWAEGDGPFRPECVGLPFDGVQVRVSALEDLAEEAAAGAEGQISIRSPSMLSEYLGDESAPTRDGFLATGDIGRVDARGRLELTGRLKLMIDIGGLKVNPLEVESVLRRHPGVQDVVAVPIPYSATASRLKAIVIPEPTVALSRDEIRSYAREHLIHYKVPRSFEIRSDVPRSPTGKILRQELMAESARASARGSE
jgi:long-chain acyl-CoA synthetase